MSFCLPCKIFQKPLSSGFALLFAILLLIGGLALQNYHARLLQERQDKTEKMVDNALSLLTYYDSKVQNGEMDAAQAKRYAIGTIEQIRPEPNSYFWVIDMQMHGIMHPFYPKMVGTDLSNYKDGKGTPLFKEAVDVAKQKGAGFIDYFWAKPDQDGAATFAKRSYIKLFAPWGWVVGSGVYLDDVSAAFWNAVFVACGLGLAVLMFALALAMTVSESLKKN